MICCLTDGFFTCQRYNQISKKQTSLSTNWANLMFECTQYRETTSAKLSFHKIFTPMGKPLFLILSLLLHSFAESQTVSDIDGNVYPTISIGTQLWMAENLKVTRFNDGTPIPLVENNMQWFNLAFTSAMCYHFNDSAIGQDYGALYNWNVISNALNVCPTGWHVPTDSEWNTMAFYLDNTVDTSLAGAVGVGTDIGIQLKESGTAYWDVGNIGTNSSGFSAFGGGYRESNGDFEDLNNWGYWWTSTSAPQSKAYMRALNAQGPTIMRFVIDRLYGNSIRCTPIPQPSK